MPLSRLGPYRIGRQLGRGGMGVVYEGTDSDSGRKAAVKVLSAPLAAQEDFRERFEVEIETLRKLNHQNIVRIFGFGEQDGHLFYVMELVEGPSLEDELRRGRRFDWREVTKIGVSVCRALKHAHDRGVIHRDIKPANLLLTEEGDVKLSDFGIAKLFGLTGMTAERGTLGTAEYMAPEQIEGRRISDRSDLYSLGGVFYALLAGRPPHVATTLAEMLQMQRFAEPDPVRMHAADVPAELDEIVMELLAKDPDERIRNPSVLARRLEAMEHGLLRRAERAKAEASEKQADSPDDAEETTENESHDIADIPPPPAMQEVPPGPDEIANATAETLTATALESKSMPGRVEDDRGPAATSEADEKQEAEERRSSFTLVSEGDEDTPAESQGAIWMLVQTAVLFVALAGVGFGIWYFLQPPTADQLYERVRREADAARPGSLIEAEDDIRAMLERYPDDSRSEELRGYIREIELLRLERRFERRVDDETIDSDLSPIEQAYLEAVQELRFDLARGIASLEALLVLFQEEEAESESARLCLELARRRLDQTRREVDRQAGSQLEFIRQQIDQARRQLESEPESSRATLRAIIQLYGDDPWAEQLVAEAREALDSPSPPSVATP